MTSIVLTVCDEFGITKAQFFSRSKTGDVSWARQEAVLRLRAAGLAIGGIAAATKLSTSTVTYWLSPDQRNSRRQKMKETTNKRAQRKRELRHAQRHLHDASPDSSPAEADQDQAPTDAGAI